MNGYLNNQHDLWLQVIGKGQLIEKYPVGNPGPDGFMSLMDVRIQNKLFQEQLLKFAEA